MLETRLTIKHLKMLHAIEATETLVKAAQVLNISQPALSSRLRDAEDILGTQLFHRRGRRLTLSRSGLLLLRSARTILSELARVESELTDASSQPKQRLRIGMPQYASFSWLPAAVTFFEQEYQQVELEIVSEAASQPRHALSNKEVDIALISSPSRDIQVDKSRFRARRLLKDEFVALLPANHPKANKRFLVVEDFIDEIYITNNAVPERNREYELFFQPNGIYPERVVQVGFVGAMLELVSAGIGTSVITRWILQSDTRFTDIVSKPLTKGGLFVYWFAIFLRNSEVESHAQALCDVIAESGAK